MGEGVPLSSGLSARELQVLSLIADGFTSKEIAAKLYLSESTVKDHRKKIIKKLKAANIVEAVYLATLEIRAWRLNAARTPGAVSPG